MPTEVSSGRICMMAEVLFLQRTFITHVFNTISELEINNATIDTAGFQSAPKSFLPQFPRSK